MNGKDAVRERKSKNEEYEEIRKLRERIRKLIENQIRDETAKEIYIKFRNRIEEKFNDDMKRSCPPTAADAKNVLRQIMYGMAGRKESD